MRKRKGRCEGETLAGRPVLVREWRKATFQGLWAPSGQKWHGRVVRAALTTIRFSTSSFTHAPSGASLAPSGHVYGRSSEAAPSPPEASAHVCCLFLAPPYTALTTQRPDNKSTHVRRLGRCHSASGLALCTKQDDVVESVWKAVPWPGSGKLRLQRILGIGFEHRDPARQQIQ